ncbi:uncharacterized protein SPPG_05990 [Spizellomyces punctatus DAOM BR117]|uniref:prephenate dehydratase n=1 Tax=Spizellomyces punctatus (strain DAOM BR117) TaxID=645134 RepID=A0A0L0HDJ0_SPIPD|nr:uncharacterized protein SPPG_05990 [Spizellomyces punctatus DAOM BR117]KNC99039.1 hypothetical protein SPPG_05990 [Spizellomyces punctatus DAOM BR117]|eukprot:XP_016607079.1 hypothetical protein SPPG_05990 [Spizellomyces punctatus DAOM BR117]
MTGVKVGFQGQKGAYSEGALVELFGSQARWAGNAVEPVGFETFAEVFDAIQNQSVQYGLIPIENSSTGTFHFTYDLLLRHSLYIVGEYQYHEKHCLVALPEVKLEDITQIKSHPYVIDQCRKFLANLDKRIAITQAQDTASSAASIEREKLTTTAAIAGARAANIYNLNILKEGIEDDENTVTRYVLISRTPIQPERHQDPRTSISLWLKNQVGMFHKAISAFALRDINISKIESRPSTRSIQLSKPWEYVLYIDVDGSSLDAPLANAIKNLEEFASHVRVLGSYPRYQPPAQRPTGVFGIGM